MIKEITFKTKIGQQQSILASEKTVKMLFKGNYAEYLRFRLNDKSIKMIKVKEYEKKEKKMGVTTFSPFMNNVIPDKEREMYEEEKKITLKKGISALGKVVDTKKEKR